MTPNFIKGSTFPPKIPKFPIALAESRETQEHEGSTEEHKMYLKLRGLRPGKRYKQKNGREMC
jgi:hypothetical protein